MLIPFSHGIPVPLLAVLLLLVVFSAFGSFLGGLDVPGLLEL